MNVSIFLGGWGGLKVSMRGKREGAERKGKERRGGV